MKQLSGQDNSFLEIERSGIPQHIASLAIYDQSTAADGKVRFKDILTHLESRLHLSPIFRSKLLFPPLGLDKPYLVDDEHFDLEYHIRHIALPKPGDWRQLCILLARINARPLDWSHPLWEMYVIEGLDNIAHVPAGSFALLIRMHHCVMDGASGTEMIAAIHDLGPQPRNIEPEHTRIIRSPPSTVEVVTRAYVNALSKPQQIFNLGRQLLGGELRKRRMDVDERGEATERKVVTRFNKKLSPHRVLDSVTLDFAEVRAIKNSLPGATINDVMLTVVSGALHKYLKAKDELPEQSLVCGCPIDVRDDSERGTGGNVIGVMGLDLCTEFSDPMERFRAVHESALRAKANAKASDVRAPKEIFETVPGGIFSLATRVTMAIGWGPYNTMLTNVPGPPNQLYFAGAQIVDGFGIGPLVPGVGLFHTASSSVMNKQGKINLSVWACRDMLPDPDVYKQCILDSYAELKRVTLGPGRRTKKKTGGKGRPGARKRTASRTKKAG